MKKIIVNNLFVGSFSFDESNIPIEVINFYQADNAKENKSDANNCYVYLAPRGQLGVDDENEVGAILFVRTAFTGVVEVIGKTGKIVESYVKNLQYEKPFQKKTVCKTSCTCANDKTGKSHQNLSVFNNKLRIDFTIQVFITLRHV